MLPVEDHLSLISSQYLARNLQPSNPSDSVVTSPSGGRNLKLTLQSLFLHCVALHLSSGILPPTDYGTTIEFLHTRAITFNSLLSPNSVLKFASLQIAPEEASLLKP